MFGLDKETFMQRKIFTLLGGKKLKKKIFIKIKENKDDFNSGEDYWESNSEKLGIIVFEMIPSILRKSTSPERMADILYKNYQTIGFDKTIRKAKLT